MLQQTSHCAPSPECALLLPHRKQENYENYDSPLSCIRAWCRAAYALAQGVRARARLCACAAGCGGLSPPRCVCVGARRARAYPLARVCAAGCGGLSLPSSRARRVRVYIHVVYSVCVYSVVVRTGVNLVKPSRTTAHNGRQQADLRIRPEQPSTLTTLGRRP